MREYELYIESLEELKEEVPRKVRDNIEMVIDKLKLDIVTDEVIVEIQELLEDISNEDIDTFTRAELMEISSRLGGEI